VTYELHHGNALHVSEMLEPDSVDLIDTSPPYFALRSYQDGGEHYDGQIGSEASPTEFVDALIACTRDWMKVLKPTGSLFVNLGDKYAGSGGHNNESISRAANFPAHGNTPRGRPGKHADERAIEATRRNAPDRYNQTSDGIPRKSLMGLPWRYAIRCIDELGLTLRAEIIWSKPNGLPESVTDRVRRSHEQWFHLTKGPSYFAAIDEVREEHNDVNRPNGPSGRDGVHAAGYVPPTKDGLARTSFVREHNDYNPLGKVPGSVWSIPSEPLIVPDHLDVDHFAAFPTEWPRRHILGWTPTGWCTACDEPRRPVVDKTQTLAADGRTCTRCDKDHGRTRAGSEHAAAQMAEQFACNETTITGYACACPDTNAPTRRAVVLDPFTGTGTVPMVAHHLGRHGIGIDLSKDYLRLAEWRCASDVRARSKVRTRSGIPDPKPPVVDGQLDMFGDIT
jgi:DNA modification methylase